MSVNKIDKDIYLAKIKDKLSNINIENKSKILNNLVDKLPVELYEVLLCIIDDTLGNINISKTEINNKYNELKERFELIENSELTFKSYSYSTGYYSYYDEEYDYNYYDDEGVSDLLKEAYSFGIYLVNNKQYNLALKVFDLIVYTNYFCKETSNQEYDYYDDEVIDCYDIDLKQVESLLEFDLKQLYSYAIYTAYFCKNRYKKIYNYLSCYKNITIEECKQLGIEKMDNLNEFYQNWIDFLSNNNDDLSENLIKDAMININIDEYLICKKNFKTHPNLYKEYILKLFENSNYNEIIKTYEEAIKEITDNKIREYISYISIDAINYSKNKLDKSKYYYTLFDSVKNIPNFLVILYNNLYNEEIKKYINKLSYKYDEFSSILDKSYYNFFLGDFKNIYINKFKNGNNVEDNMLYLMMLYLSDTNKMTLVKDDILRTLTRNFNEYHYRNLDIDLNNKCSNLLKKIDNFKKINQIDEELKKLFIDKIRVIINNKINYIFENKKKYRYSEASILVVILDDVLSNNNYIKQGEYINEIEKKYIRFSTFRKELKRYK